MTPKLRGVLADYLAGRGGAVADPLVPTESGARRTPDNLRQRVCHPVIEHARQVREARGHPPLPARVTPHTLRRTYCSLWLEAEPPAPIPWLMDQVGHEKPDTLLRIYAQVIQRDRAKIGWAFDALRWPAPRGPIAARMGRRMGRRMTKPATGTSRRVGTHCEISGTSRDFLEAAEGTRTLDLLHGKQTL